jgi:hypothetical protein
MAPYNSTSLGLIWTTTSIHGNTIYLYERDWKHILDHPEMMGREDEVKRAVESPVVVKSGRFTDSCTFERPSTTNPEGIRVFVQHETEMFLSGGVQGWVTTAFDITRKTHPNPRIGNVLGAYPENAGDENV